MILAKILRMLHRVFPSLTRRVEVDIPYSAFSRLVQVAASARVGESIHLNGGNTTIVFKIREDRNP